MLFLMLSVKQQRRAAVKETAALLQENQVVKSWCDEEAMYEDDNNRYFETGLESQHNNLLALWLEQVASPSCNVHS